MSPRKEQTSVITIVLVSTLKYAPATPPSNMNGIKITIVLIEEPQPLKASGI